MTEQELQTLLTAQKQYFQSGATRPVSARINALRKLHAAIRAHETEIAAALEADLGKSPEESYMCEIGLVLSELTWLIRHTKKLSRARRAATPLAQSVSHSYVRPEPRGTVLIMSPWNYPFLLTIEPLADAIAADNTAIVKPSAYSPKTSAVMAILLQEVFPAEQAAVVTGGRAENQMLLEQKYDLIFFTGSQSVGKVVMEKAARHLTPVVLELGGKSPCIVDASAKLPLAARRIVWGKYLNCGQTCVAPDYVLCHASVKEAFLDAVKQEIQAQFGVAPLGNPSYGKMINRKHFDRVCDLIDPDQVVYGGDSDAETCMIEPTVLEHVSWEDPVMQEEIFGPVMPVLTWEDPEELEALLADRPKPLALYVFAEDRVITRRFTENLRFGGGCVNDTVIHLATSAMGFGGVGESGMGAYHGEAGFRTFSHEKSIVDKKTWLDLPMRYQPFTGLHDRLVRMFMH